MFATVVLWCSVVGTVDPRQHSLPWPRLHGHQGSPQVGQTSRTTWFCSRWNASDFLLCWVTVITDSWSFELLYPLTFSLSLRLCICLWCASILINGIDKFCNFMLSSSLSFFRQLWSSTLRILCPIKCGKLLQPWDANDHFLMPHFHSTGYSIYVY